MKANKTILILGAVVLMSVLIFVWFKQKKEILQEKTITNQEKMGVNKVGLWEDCNPQTNNCETGLECKRYGVTDIYRCIKYLKEKDECGISEAEICGEGLTCTDTDQTRQRCGIFSTKGEQECFAEPLQTCRPL